MFEFSDKQIKALLEGIFSGSITDRILPESLYMAIGSYLKKGLYDGFGYDLSSAEGMDLELLAEIRENVYIFSAAKTFQQTKEMSELLIGEKGKRSFSEFKKEATKFFETHNVDWLKSEYETAYGQGQMAVKWNQIEAQKNALPLLRYSAIMDKNTSEICKPLDGIILPVGHPLWKRYSPLNHFRCRCILEQLDEGKVSSDHEVKSITKELDEKVNDVFKMNPGIDKVIFSDSHPYFEVAKKDKGFAANNFNLPIPDKD